MKKGSKPEDQVIAQVRRAAAVRGHGVLGRGHEAAGLSPDYLRSMRAGSVGLGRVRAIVEGCDMDLGEVVRHALDTGAVARFVADGQRLAPYTKDFPMAVFNSVYRMRAWWEEQDGGVDLEAIDQQRYEDPHAALRAISDALGVVSGPKTYARALGIWGSAQRMCYRLDYATMGIGLAIEAAQAACDRELLAVLLQRAAYVLIDRCEFDWAAGCSDAMLDLRSTGGDFDAMGRGFVVHGIVLSAGGSSASAVRCCCASLALLDTDSSYWRFSAYQTLSLCYEALGKLDETEESAQHAEAIGVGGAYALGRLAWVRGRIALRRGDQSMAEPLYRRAFGLLRSATVDAALVGAELARVLLDQGRSREAEQLVSGFSWLVDALSDHPFDENSVMSTAVFDLLWAGSRARLSVAVLERATEVIEKGRATAVARLRANLRF